MGGGFGIVVNWSFVDPCEAILSLQSSTQTAVDSLRQEFAEDSLNAERLNSSMYGCPMPLDNRRVCLDFWIMGRLALVLMGDDRGLDPNARPEDSRAQLLFDPNHPEQGIVALVNGSQWAFGSETGVTPLRTVPTNQVSITQASADTVVVHVKLMTSKCANSNTFVQTMCGEIDNDVYYARDIANGSAWHIAKINGNSFPSVASFAYGQSGWSGGFVQVEAGYGLAAGWAWGPLWLLQRKLERGLAAIGAAADSIANGSIPLFPPGGCMQQ